MTPSDLLLAEQQTYYRLRAADYDRWVTDYMAPVHAAIVDHMRHSRLTGQVLEIAAGTGHLTEPLCAIAEHVTAMDAAPEMLEVLSGRRLPNLTTVCADIFTWHPTDRWDAVFFSNWLAHVPESHFDQFWEMLASVLRPAGRVVFLDVTSQETAIETEVFQEDGVDLVRRHINGDSFKVVKRYWEPKDLLHRLALCGWSGIATPIGTELGRGFVLYDVGRTRD